MASLNHIQIENVVEADHVLLLQDSYVPINIQILQVLLPLIKAYDGYDGAQNLLQVVRTVRILVITGIQGALDYDLVKVGEYLILL
jgi:hypothetical protein